MQSNASSLFKVIPLVHQLRNVTECGVRFKAGAWQEADHCGGFEEVDDYCLVVDIACRAELLELRQETEASQTSVYSEVQ